MYCMSPYKIFSPTIPDIAQVSDKIHLHHEEFKNILICSRITIVLSRTITCMFGTRCTQIDTGLHYIRYWDKFSPWRVTYCRVFIVIRPSVIWNCQINVHRWLFSWPQNHKKTKNMLFFLIFYPPGYQLSMMILDVNLLIETKNRLY